MARYEISWSEQYDIGYRADQIDKLCTVLAQLSIEDEDMRLSVCFLAEKIAENANALLRISPKVIERVVSPEDVPFS